jgi:hypothetical protein
MSMLPHENFIQVYPNVVGSNLCQALIDLLESSPESQMRVDNHERPNFSQISLQQMQKGERFLEPVMQAMKQCFQRYSHSLPTFAKYFPHRFTLEQFRVKKYRNDDIDVFEDHVDVSDYTSARRFLACLFYLNSVEEGGETEFFFPNDQNKLIKPIQGQVVVFPPNWQFPHRGRKTISGNKYIMSSYFHFIDA